MTHFDSPFFLPAKNPYIPVVIATDTPTNVTIVSVFIKIPCILSRAIIAYSPHKSHYIMFYYESINLAYTK